MVKRLFVATMLTALWSAWALAQGGTIKGKVNYRWVAKFPVVVFIEEMPGKTFPAPKQPAHMDQKNNTFIPRVLPILVGTKVEFLNSDPFDHNIYSPEGKYDLGNFGKGQKRSYTFTKPGVYTQLCKLHPQMIAYIVVLKTPYFAVADKNGNFEIKNVPPGNWKLKVWGERLRPSQLQKTFGVKVEAGKVANVTIDL